VVRVAWRMLRQHPAGAVATVVALWCAVFVVTGCGVLLESGIRYHGTPGRYAGSTVLVATTELAETKGIDDGSKQVESEPLPDRGRVDLALVSKVAALPGVRAVVPDSAVPVQVLVPAHARTPGTARPGTADPGTARPGTADPGTADPGSADPGSADPGAGGGSGAGGVGAEGHPWSAAVLTPYVLREGGAPGAGQVVVDASLGVRVGQSVRVVLPRGVRTYAVSGVAGTAVPGVRAPTVFFGDGEAAALAGHPGAADVLGVLGVSGVDGRGLERAVRAVLPARAEPAGAQTRVYAGADRGLVESPDVGGSRELMIAVSSVFGGNTLLIAAIVIAGAVGLSIRQRHRDVALLRAIAATPRQVRRMVVVETLALAVLAGATAVWPGLAGARWLRGQFVDRGFVADDLVVRVSWLPPLVAASAGVLIAVVAAWAGGLRPSRIRPAAAMAEAVVERRGIGVVRALLGILALAGGIVLSVLAAHLSAAAAAGVGVAVVFTLVLAVTLLAPLIITAVVGVLGLALTRVGVTGRLAAANVAASARRLSTVLSAVVLAVGLGGSLTFLQSSITHVAAGQARAGLVADHVVVPGGAGLPAAAAERVARVPGVAAAAGVRRDSFLVSADDTRTAQGVEPAAFTRTVDLGVTAGSLADLHGATVAIDSLVADEKRLRVGDHIHGFFGDGAPADLRIVAVYARGLGFAEVTLPADLLRAHTDGLDTQVLVADEPGADTGAGIEAALAEAAPGAHVIARGAYQSTVDKNLAEQGWINQTIVGVLVLYVLIAAVNSLVTAALARRRELAVLRLAGATRRQLLRTVTIEQLVLLGIALVTGTAIAAATLVPMVRGATGQATPHIPPAGWAAVLVGTVLVGLAATLTPTRRALRTAPMEAIGIRE
jgi:putative ABC transport system permease protein